MKDHTFAPGGRTAGEWEKELGRLHTEVMRRAPYEACRLLRAQSDTTIGKLLTVQNPANAVEILWKFPEERRSKILHASPREFAEQWQRNHRYPNGTVGRLMQPPYAIFPPDLTVRESADRLRELVKKAFISYAFVADSEGRLLGVVAFRELLFADSNQPLRAVMLPDPFSLRPDASIIDTMRVVLRRHYPVYPVCDERGGLLGIVRGQTLFERQAFELTAQAGAMVGVDREERLATPWWRSLKFRHPWLQLNLLTAFLAAAVVGVFQETIERVVILAVFLPVLIGQSVNTGCQALAVALRGITLGELTFGKARSVVLKEAFLGALNGMLVGVIAGLGMLLVAQAQGNPHAVTLAWIVLLAMTGSCVVGGISGAAIPLTLKRLGVDPATASSIFLTTATEVASMGLFLWLATWLIAH